MKLTPQEIFDKLVKEEKLTSKEGLISFSLSDVSIVVKQRDVVGNILQEWLQGWLEEKDIDYSLNDNSQMPPDFYLDPDDKTTNLLEVKAFNYSASPAFDIADFRMYESEIIDKPYMLYVDYLIFGYDMDTASGIVSIKDIWLKKVWEITSSSSFWPLTLQVKKGTVHKIRPKKWYGGQAKVFSCVEDFVSAIEQTVWQNPATKPSSAQWLNHFNSSYKKHYGLELSIPRWNEVKNTYQKTDLN